MDVEGDPRGPGDDLDRLEGVGPGRDPSGAPPAGRVELAAQHRGEMPRLGRQGGVEGRQLGRGGPGLDARQRRRLTAVAGQEHQAGLEEREVAQAATHVAHRRVEQAGQQRGPQLGFVLGDRVHQPDGPAARRVRGQPQHVVHRRRDERERQHLDVAGRGHRLGHRAVELLAAGQPPARRGGRQDRGQVLVPGEADDLLDEIGRDLQIGSPRRRLDLQQHLAGGDDAADCLQVGARPRRG